MTSKPVVAHCDAGCKKDFTFTKLRTKKMKNGIDKSFFLCPYCKQEYVAYYTSADTLKLQKDMRKLSAITDHSEVNLDAHWAKVERLKEMIKQSMDEARATIEG